jgi:hypothetical protein
MNGLLTIKKASEWASEYLNRDISPSNISYLIQYGKVKKHQKNGTTLLNQEDLKSYYQSYRGKREFNWKRKLGQDLNWALSFDHLREKDTTKHVHRLHPYKGKFIPQLVEYFIDRHTDDFKKNVYFKKGDIILDPFSGSGTALVQANEMGMHSVGIDISRFNCMITDVKLFEYNLDSLTEDVNSVIKALSLYEIDSNISAFEKELYIKLSDFNNNFFPGPKYKYQVQQGSIDENSYGLSKAKEFEKIYKDLVKKHDIKLKQKVSKSFLDKWYMENVRKEINIAFKQVRKINNLKNKQALAIILSRTIRSCRATTHSDLATLKNPQLTTYYCYKHKKICKPLFSIRYWFTRYANDTLNRLSEFERLKANAFYSIISADSRTANIFEQVKKKNTDFYNLLKKRKIQGIFTSPPYVGQIDYHEQHAYAYDLFGFKRKDELEIGPLYKGKGYEARKSYVNGVTDVLINCKKFLANSYNIFIVANDKFNLYPTIAEKSGMKIIQRFKRPVLNRTERSKSPPNAANLLTRKLFSI